MIKKPLTDPGKSSVDGKQYLDMAADELIYFFKFARCARI